MIASYASFMLHQSPTKILYNAAAKEIRVNMFEFLKDFFIYLRFCNFI